MDSSQLPINTYLLGPFKIKGKENLIETDTGDLVVSPKVMNLLIYLCRNSQNVVTFDELNKAIWPTEFVGDNAIYNLIGQLRKALNDDSSNPIYIQSISKVGYRLMVEAIPAKEEPQLVDTPTITQEPVQHKNVETKLRRLGAIFTFVTICLLLSLLLSHYLAIPTDHSKDNERQFKVAQYQLNRSDLKGLNQAINMLQQIAVIAPNWNEPKIELAIAFIRKSNREFNNKDFWLTKAKSLIASSDLGLSGDILDFILNTEQTDSNYVDRLAEQLESKQVPTSLVIVSSDIIFELGKTNLAKHLLESEVQRCMDCPYLYRKLAKTYMTTGNIQKGLESYSNYRQLINRSNSTPAQDIGLTVLDFKSLQEMAAWHFQSNLPANLLSNQRNTLALFYLSLNLIEQAENILTTSANSSTGFFDLYTLAAIAGAKGEVQTAYTILKKRQEIYPSNKRFKLSLVYSLWQLEKYSEALELLKQLELIPMAEPLPDFIPFSPWAMYGDLLMQTGSPVKGQMILEKLEHQLAAGVMPNSQNADIRLASVLALQNKKEEAISELLIAIKQGWVSDFHQNWWYIQDSPYFRKVKNDTRFKAAVNLYNDKINTLHKKPKPF